MSSEPRRSPYQGLTPFDERDAPYFFGREKDARLIAADLFAAPVSVLYGASGVGKSSVLRAGVLPLLRPRTDLAAVVFNTWQSEPLAPLKSAILETLFPTFEPGSAELREFQDEVSRNEYAPLSRFLPILSKCSKRRLMIILDQFEEYSLYHPEGSLFSEQFPGATTIGDLSASIMISLREDALARLDEFEGTIPALFDNLRRIDHLDADAAREAIRKPLDKYNADHAAIESPMSIDPELVDAVLEQVRTGRVVVGLEGGTGGTGSGAPGQTRVEAPYLQLVMTRIWNYERSVDSNVMRWETLNSLGGAPRIVQTHLDGVMTSFTEEERDIAARVFQQLVTPSGTKIAHTVRDLADYAAVGYAQLSDILERLSRGTDRVLRPVAALPEWPHEPRYEIFHDRLAPAILDWRSRYLKERELSEATRRELEERDVERTTASFPRPDPSRAFLEADTPDYDLIADLLFRGNVVIVVGADLFTSDRTEGSRWTMNSSIPPSGWELMQQMASEVHFPEELNRMSFAALASYYAEVFTSQDLVYRLRSIFQQHYVPTRAHRFLARLALAQPRLFLTTTFDRMLETALDSEEVRYDVLFNLAESAKPLAWRPFGEPIRKIYAKEFHLQPNVTCVYKLFGSAVLGPNLTNYIATEEQQMMLAAEMIGGRLPPADVKEALANKLVLFLGMGLGGFPQRLIVNDIRQGERARRRTGWAIVRNASPLDRQRWRAARISVYDHDLADFVLQLGRILGI